MQCGFSARGDCWWGVVDIVAVNAKNASDDENRNGKRGRGATKRTTKGGAKRKTKEAFQVPGGSLVRPVHPTAVWQGKLVPIAPHSGQYLILEAWRPWSTTAK